jgi:two-component system NarL family sensor kinase
VPNSDREPFDRLIAAEQDERRRIALFLHDGPVQNLAGIALMLDAAQHSIEAGRYDEARTIIATAVERHRTTIRELRDLSFALEPVVLRDQGFGPAVRALAEQVGTTHELRLDLDVEAAEELGQTAQVALYTVIRELLEQSIRRGPPNQIGIRIWRTDDESVKVCVADDAEPERRRGSLEGVEERVRQLHGSIVVSAGGNGGTEVNVELPAYVAQR